MSTLTIKQGYKQTDIGIIPEDWEVRSLGEVCIIDKENLGSSTPPNYEFKYISLENVNQGSLKEYSELLFQNAPSRAKRIIKKDNILVSTVRPNLQSHLFFTNSSNDWIASTGFAVLECIKEVSDSKFIFTHLFGSILNRQIENLITGSNYPAISSKEVKNLQIPLPPLPEQIAIATVLSDIDSLITSLTTLIAKKKQIKIGTMQKLLQPQADWEVRSLGDFSFDISDGNYSSKYPSSSEFKTTGIPFIRANNIKMMTVVDNDMRYISPHLHIELAKGHLKKDDILITTRGEIGQIAIVPDFFVGSNINAQIVRINTDNQIDKKYLAYFLLKSETQEILMSFQTGSALKQLPVGKLKELEIIYPQSEVQTQIATILTDMDEEITALESKLAKYRLIKTGAMQELLTGRIRLV